MPSNKGKLTQVEGEELEYIISTWDKLTDKHLRGFAEAGAEIVYNSSLLPIIGIKASNKTYSDLLDNKLIKRIRPSREGVLLEITIIPSIPQKILLKADLVGWNVAVAVLDSGINESKNLHTVKNRNFTDEKYVIDQAGHGTCVAKIINHFAPGVQIFNAKITNNPRLVKETRVLQALDWVYKQNVDIINMSLGFPRETQDIFGHRFICEGNCEICETVKKINSLGKIIVAAAGNSGPRIGSITCPGNSSGALTVGAVTDKSKLAQYSGRGSKGQKKPDVLAPGNLTEGTTEMKGTSVATPVVSGILSAVYTKYKNNDKLINTIKDTCNHLGYKYYEQGNGLINLSRFLEVLSDEKTDSEVHK